MFIKESGTSYPLINFDYKIAILLLLLWLILTAVNLGCYNAYLVNKKLKFIF